MAMYYIHDMRYHAHVHQMYHDIHRPMHIRSVSWHRLWNGLHGCQFHSEILLLSYSGTSKINLLLAHSHTHADTRKHIRINTHTHTPYNCRHSWFDSPTFSNMLLSS